MTFTNVNSSPSRSSWLRPTGDFSRRFLRVFVVFVIAVGGTLWIVNVRMGHCSNPQLALWCFDPPRLDNLNSLQIRHDVPFEAYVKSEQEAAAIAQGFLREKLGDTVDVRVLGVERLYTLDRTLQSFEVEIETSPPSEIRAVTIAAQPDRDLVEAYSGGATTKSARKRYQERYGTSATTTNTYFLWSGFGGATAMLVIMPDCNIRLVPNEKTMSDHVSAWPSAAPRRGSEYFEQRYSKTESVFIQNRIARIRKYIQLHR